MADSIPVDAIRTVMAVGLAGVLLLLRLDAFRFRAAEYDVDAPDDGGPGILTRLAWPLAALALAAGVAVLLPAGPSAVGLGGDPFLAPGTVLWGLVGAAVGMGAILGLARLREGVWPPRLGAPAETPRFAADAVSTAIVDEMAFRGVLLGLLLLAGVPALLAFFVQLLAYGLETRLGRSRRTLDLLGEALALGALTGILALASGSVIAPLIAHAGARFAALEIPSGLRPLVPGRLL